MKYASQVRFWVNVELRVVVWGVLLAIAVSACSSAASDSQSVSSSVPETAETTRAPADPGIVEDREAAYVQFSALLGSFGGATFDQAQAELLAEVDCGRISSSSSASTFVEGWDLFNAQRVADGLGEDILKTLTVVAVAAYCPQWNLAVGAAFNPQLLLADSTAQEFGESVNRAVDDGRLPERGREIVVDAFLSTDAYTDEQKAEFTEAVEG